MAEETVVEVYNDLQERMPGVMLKARMMLANDHPPRWIVERLHAQRPRLARASLERFRVALDYLVQRIVDGEEVCDN